MTRLRRSDTSAPGLRRLPHGGGFRYCVPDGSRPAPADLDRIRELVIPPAWTDVWICPHANGHLQATGVDAAGRRQYLYHPDWRAKRDREKHDHVLTVASGLRRHCAPPHQRSQSHAGLYGCTQRVTAEKSADQPFGGRVMAKS
jgi:DNA topoisomerase IB